MDNSYRFEQHIAQQSRRNKLRVSQDLTPAAAGVEVRNAILQTGSSFLSSEMINFSLDSNALSDQRDIMLRQGLAATSQCGRQILTAEDASLASSSFSNSFLKSSGEVLNGGYWKTPHQSCDWAVNCASNSLSGDITTITDSSAYSLKPSFPSQVYQRSITLQDVEMDSIVQHDFRDQSNLVDYLPFDNCRSWINGELGSIARKSDEELRTFMTDSNPQGLSLSLSSQFKEPDQDLQQSISKNHQDSKPDKSENLCRLPKKQPSIGCKNSGIPVNTYHSTGPLGPFTGYATILKSSKFLKPAQVLLDEFCGSTGSKFLKPFQELEKNSGEDNEAAVKENNPCSQASTFYGSNETTTVSVTSESHQPEYQQKKAKLLYMLEEVYRRYKQYHQQMQMVVSSFESVAGLSSATPYISMALRTVSRHFRCLKTAISEQLKHLRKALGEDSAGTSSSKGETTSSPTLNQIEQSFHKQKSGLSNLGFLESQHVWRPQRGLPERAVAILRAWLFDHFLHPYPTDTDKHMLATQTGLSRNQVSNWFINARVRVWKPMVEEIHMLEKKSLAEMNKTHHLSNHGTSTIQNNRWTRVDQPEVADENLQCSGADAGGESQWNHDTGLKTDGRVQANMDGDSISFMSYQPVALTLGLRQRVESAQQQRRQQLQQQQEDQVMRHYGSEMNHDFVG